MVNKNVARRRVEKFNAQQAFSEPLANLKTTQDSLPLPHLETFLHEVDALNSDLIEHIFVSKLFSVSEENIKPNDSQLIYSKMLAYGFVKNPQHFVEQLTVAYNSEKHPLLHFSANVRDLYKLGVSSPIAQSIMLFGIESQVGEKLNKLSATPNAMLIRLCQLNILDFESLQRYSHVRNQNMGYQRSISMIGNVNLHKATVALENELVELIGNQDIILMMLISQDTELVLQALRANIKAMDVFITIKELNSSPEQAIKARLYGIDYSLISALNDFA